MKSGQRAINEIDLQDNLKRGYIKEKIHKTFET